MNKTLIKPAAIALPKEEYGSLIIQNINNGMMDGSILPLFTNRNIAQQNTAYASELAEIKRFLERWSADSQLREDIKDTNVYPLDEKYGLEETLDIASLRSLWDEDGPLEIPQDAALRYKAFNLEKITYRNIMRMNSADSFPSYNTWRSRQMKRCTLELAPLTAYSIVHAPFAIELSQGCSVGCWFCGISAPKLEDIFFYTEENANLFKGVILALKDLLGTAVGKGFCYWATDPFDNPDYEKFLVDFHQYTGTLPQTTTALPLKNIERTKSLLALSQRLGGNMDRFSLLSLKQLEKVHSFFTAEELLYVELVTQNKESYTAKAKAGRAATGAEKRSSANTNETGNQVASGTIACVSGFLISMVEKTVKLISPCEATAVYPLGYMVFQEGSFENAAEFQALIEDMKIRNLVGEIAQDRRLRFLPFLDYSENEKGFTLHALYYNTSFHTHSLFKAMGSWIQKGTHTVSEILAAVDKEGLYHEAEKLYVLNLIFQEGVLIEDIHHG